MIIDTSKVAASLDGNKTYLLLGAAALYVVGNHLGVVPDAVSSGAKIDPNNWLFQLFTLSLGGTARSALKKMETAPSAPKSGGQVL